MADKASLLFSHWRPQKISHLIYTDIVYAAIYPVLSIMLSPFSVVVFTADSGAKYMMMMMMMMMMMKSVFALKLPFCHFWTGFQIG